MANVTDVLEITEDAIAPERRGELHAAIPAEFHSGVALMDPPPADRSREPAAAKPRSPDDRLAIALLQRLGPQRYDFWFERKTRLALAGNALIVEASNAFSADWIRRKFAAELRAVAREVAGRDMEVSVRVAQPAACEPAPIPDGPWGAPARAVPLAAPRAVSSAPAFSAPINPRHTLEEFVIGPSNQLAYHAACKIAQAPGREFNPLFIHGHCGLGKTHLLQGICQRFAQLHPTRKWLYVTGEQFTNEFLEAIKAHKTDAFRRRIRSAELLVIDDVHFLAHKKATQEEFLHTFNQIDASGRQIVLASDCAPKQIRSLSDQLSSRFISGMVLRVDSPDLPTRLEILRRRVVKSGWNISDPVLMHIAQSSASSVRELEGLLLQVVAGIRLINAGSPDVATALAGIKERTAMSGPISAERIVAAVAGHFAIAAAAILGSGREKIVCIARALAMHLARRHTAMSYPEIGRAIGNKNHSTVIAACQRIEALLLSGQVLCWTTPEGPRHQALPDILHELESAIRRRQ